MNDVVDLAIVGGGPVGLFASYYAGLRSMSCSIIESLPALGGRLVSVFPEKYIYDVPGFPKVRARELASNLVRQAMQSSPSIHLSETVERLERCEGYLMLKTQVATHRARSVLVASGIGVSTPKRHTAVGADAFEGRGLEYIVTSPEQYRGKRVVVVGGGDSAVDWAQELATVAASVTLIHRSSRFRAHEKNIQALVASGVSILTDAEIASFEGGEHLERLVVQLKKSGESQILAADVALVMFGFQTDGEFMRDWGLSLTEGGEQIVVDELMRTTVSGVYAVGDIASHRAKICLLATGFGEAAIAVNQIKCDLCPDEERQPIYSTTLMDSGS